MNSTSLQPRLRYDFADLASPTPNPTDPADVYHRITGRFSIHAAGELIDGEERFPVVEFAIRSRIWARGAVKSGQDFLFERAEDGEGGLVWLRHQPDGWHTGSSHQTLACELSFTTTEAAHALDDYYKRLRAAVKAQFNVDIQSLFAWLSGR